MNRKSNMETYITICKIATGICYMAQETQTGALYQPRGVQWEDGREVQKGGAPHSSILAWKIPWREEPGRLQSMGSLGVGHN